MQLPSKRRVLSLYVSIHTLILMNNIIVSIAGHVSDK